MILSTDRTLSFGLVAIMFLAINVIFLESRVAQTPQSYANDRAIIENKTVTDAYTPGDNSNIVANTALQAAPMQYTQ